MISNKMEKLLNAQVNEEIYSSYLYLSMAAYFSANNFTGFAAWMQEQSKEEYAHAMKFYHYIESIGGKVTLEAINKPQAEWSSPIDAFENAHKHELHITAKINDLMNLAIDEKDHATNSFLRWFVDEQVEEVATVVDIINKFKMIGDSKGNLYMLNKELGKRAIK